MVPVKLKIIKRINKGSLDLGRSALWTCPRYGYEYYDHNAALARDTFGESWDKVNASIPDELAYTIFPEATR